MFQMNKKMFRQFWPVIAAHIGSEQESGRDPANSAPMPSPSVAAEAGYVLGIAMGYALGTGQTPNAARQPRASLPGWQVGACGDLNWPRITTSGAAANSRR